MTAGEARSLFAYNEWANDRIFRAVEELTEGQFTQQIDSSFNSIRDTLAHVVGAEWIWLKRWKGASPTSPPDWAVPPSASSLRVNLREVELERSQFLSDLDDDGLERAVTYTNLSGDPFTNPLRDLFSHLVNHSTYHRGQVSTMLRQVGAIPPPTDLIAFLRVTRG